MKLPRPARFQPASSLPPACLQSGPVSFSVPGDARPFGTKVTRMGKITGTRKTDRAETWQKIVADYAAEEMGDRPLLAGPVAVTIRCTFRRPMSELRKRTAKEAEFRAKIPDVDKVARLVLDAMEDVVYGNDSQVASLCVAKRTAAQDASRLPEKLSLPANTLVTVSRIADTAEGEDHLMRRIYG